MRYWEIQDGTNCGEKTWLTTKITTALEWRTVIVSHLAPILLLLALIEALGGGKGLIGSTYSIVLYQPKTVLEGIQRAGGTTLTMASLGAIFGITTCITAQVREKPDDAINYFIGGCTSGALLGIKSHSYSTGSMACVSLGALAAFVKISQKEGWDWIPSEPKI